MEISELELRRAVNIIWTAAGNYGFTPDFKAFNTDGTADIYWNFIIGAVRRYFDYSKFEAVFRSFSEYEDSFIYESLFWLGLENTVFEKSVISRPVLKELRMDYAGRVIKQYSDTDDFRLFDALANAHYRRVVGLEPILNSYSLSLLDELEFSVDMGTEEIVQRVREIFKHWFDITIQEKRRDKRTYFKGLKRKGGNGRYSTGRFKRFAAGFADRPQNCYGGESTGIKDTGKLISMLSEKELRQFMESKFGASIFTDTENKLLEKTLCNGNHSNCHLLITDGRPAAVKINNGFEALERQREAEQRARNRYNFKQNRNLYQTSISRLRQKLQNSVLMYLQASESYGQTGCFAAGRAWRGQVISDDRLFVKKQPDSKGNLSVDILLDASTSQRRRQELVSAQGYIIASALTQCNIPCRVMSFCSMTGFTIINIFRDYKNQQSNDKIFDYVANGCNRDGLAIRTVSRIMQDTAYENKILVILSDVKPNDVVKLAGNGEEEYISYESEASIKDTAVEVRSARAAGISVVCVFTGEDEDAPSARLVYGSDFIRIKSIDKLAEAVGTILQEQIRNM